MEWWAWVLVGILLTMLGVCVWASWDARRIYRQLPPEVRDVVDEWDSPWTPRHRD